MLPEFLNVDLELESQHPLHEIAEKFGDKVHVLYQGPVTDSPHFLALEVYAGDDHDPESIIVAFCDLIERLPAKARAAWSKCVSRRFDIGIESAAADSKPFRPLCLKLSVVTLGRVAALSAEVIITVYPVRTRKQKSKTKAAKK
jgi:hypothetical protein